VRVVCGWPIFGRLVILGHLEANFCRCYDLTSSGHYFPSLSAKPALILPTVRCRHRLLRSSGGEEGLMSVI
jgi:hypothetical protein